MGAVRPVPAGQRWEPCGRYRPGRDGSRAAGTARAEMGAVRPRRAVLVALVKGAVLWSAGEEQLWTVKSLYGAFAWYVRAADCVFPVVLLSKETLDLTCRRMSCFPKFSEMEKMVNMEAEINEIKLKIEMMQLENETADITHPFYLGKKCEILQDMNRHLEAILKEKRDLRKRLIKHRCEESLPIEAAFHKCIVELLAEAVTFIEKLESHLQSVRSIPQVPHMMSNMDTTLSKTKVLMIELEELTEQILKWEELQKEVYSNNVCNTADLDFGLSLA
ncbi:HAUS augmin-like complex subunit 2 [Parus major]|uniref:HAUS augmin-like complex subunit 2 n=1 Tax=Parus major TaxID=9157 RepID=UPI00077105D2|nr:HAUS augmin-like complex subunit 2 [Parus major]